MFPFSIKGEFYVQRLYTQDVNKVLALIELELTRVQATDIRFEDNKVAFRGGIFRWVTNWNILGPVGYGEIEVIYGDPGVIRYNLSCVQMLVGATFMVGIIAWLIAVTPHSAQALVIVPIAFWLWFVGMNYLVAAIRLPRFVRNAVSKGLLSIHSPATG